MKKARKKSKRKTEIVLEVEEVMVTISQSELDQLKRDAKEKTPFERWCYWFETACDHHASPESWQAWDGAIETTCEYITEQLCGEGLDLDKIYEIMRKTKAKLRDSP